MDEPIRERMPSNAPAPPSSTDDAFAGYLDELERICEAATPGPWMVQGDDSDQLFASDGHDVAQAWAWKGTRDLQQRQDNARLIEAARHALPELIAKVRELQVKLDASASVDAFNAIALTLGCPAWDYPGQLVRDVGALKVHAANADERLAQLRRSLEDAHRSPPWNWRDTIGYLLDRDAQHEVQR
jgi:hypothetical protein